LISTDVARALREDLYVHLCRLDSAFYARYPLGDLLARTSQDIEAVRRFFRSAVHRLISLVAVSAIAPIVMLTLAPGLTLWLVPSLAVAALVLALLARRVRRQTTAVQRDFGAMTEVVQQNLAGIRTIQLHAQEERELAHLSKFVDRYARDNVQLLSTQAVLVAAGTLASGFMTCTVLCVGGRAVLESRLSIGTLTAFLFYLAMLLAVLRECSWPVYSFLAAMVGASRIFEILEQRPGIRDCGVQKPNGPLSGRMETRSLSYAYPAEPSARPTPWVLDDVTLAIEPGEFVAIVGPVGAGKSTLLRCLARQLEPQLGEVLFDGYKLTDLPIAGLRRELTFVSQECRLFAASIAQNIAYDDPTRPEASIWAAASAAGLKQTLERWPEGLETSVGDRGVKLSGGQRQRVALARGLIRQTPVCLLDDCLSGLDAETEAGIVAQLQAQRGLRTIVLVTHRARTAQKAQRIFVLEAGRLVDVGTHDELSLRCEYYKQLNESVDPRRVSAYASTVSVDAV
jgi:ATP-binding cassette subfamily B protein